MILLLLGLWEIAAQWDWISNALNIQSFLVPAPSDIATSLWRDRSLWWQKAILNTANIGWFSADRAIREYARDIWRIELTRN